MFVVCLALTVAQSCNLLPLKAAEKNQTRPWSGDANFSSVGDSSNIQNFKNKYDISFAIFTAFTILSHYVWKDVESSVNLAFHTI